MLLGIPADIWLYGVCLVIGILLSLPSAVGRTARAGRAPQVARVGRVGRAPQAARAGTLRAPRSARASQTSHTHHLSARPALPRYSLLNPVALATFLGGFGAVGLMVRGAGISGWLSLIL